MAKAKSSSTPQKRVYRSSEFDKYFSLLHDIKISSTPRTRPTSIEDEIAREQKIKNDDAEQDIGLKKTTLNRLFGFLAIETFIIFAFAFLQATHYFRFGLEEWSFKLLVSATITQITVMLYVAVNYLFPKIKK